MTQTPSVLSTRTSTRVRPGLVVVVILLGYLALPMSMSGASVAVPEIGADLEVGGSATSWVVTGYFLAASSLMLVIGAVADNLGRRRVYRVGAVVYTVSGVVAALAPSIPVLLSARIICGAGAAAIMAAGAATAAATFTGAARNKMFAAIGTSAALGLAVGPPLTGLLIQHLGWRAGFVTFALAGGLLILGSMGLPESRRADPTAIDWPGAMLVVAGLCSLMLAIAGAPTRGWGHPITLAGLVISAACLFGLARVEPRAASPLLDLDLLRNRHFVAWLLSLATIAIGYGGLLAHLPSFLHGVMGLSPAESGLMLLTPIVPMLVLPLLVGQLSSVVSVRLLIGLALAMIAAGNAWLGVMLTPQAAPVDLIAPMLTVGLGLGIGTGIVDAQAMNQVDPDRHGLAAGMINTVRGASTTITMALLGSVLAALATISTNDPELAGRLVTGNIPTQREDLTATVSNAWLTAQIVIGAICAAAATVVVALLRPRNSYSHGPAGG
ncbi:MFS transporter [Promicromonospora vindobonensis]|uniref:MFS transporter n=1 Tax=Promicromonospora vindobonensis TaxID=195748 RepID=A0ABW5VRV5_9MICO